MGGIPGTAPSGHFPEDLAHFEVFHEAIDPSLCRDVHPVPLQFQDSDACELLEDEANLGVLDSARPARSSMEIKYSPCFSDPSPVSPEC